MRWLLFLAIGVLAAPAAELAGWKLVWADEFETPGLPDGAKWTYEVGMVRNREAQFYTKARKENARVEGGKLVIEARKEAWKGAEFTSASVISRGRGEWKYGRIDVRAKLPDARGTWPAIWMLPADWGRVPWPRCGEIDLMEHVGHERDVVHANLHTERYNHTRGNGRGARRKLEGATAGFHVYSLEWSAGRMVMRVDGEVLAGFRKEEGDGVEEWPFEKPFYLIMNLAVGGTWGGAEGIDGEAFPQRMEVDYVRVYEAAVGRGD